MHPSGYVQSSGGTHSDRFASGTRVGDYTIESECSVEDGGVVYFATHVMLPRRVELKVLHAGAAGTPALAKQLLREACLLEALAGAGHPGIPRVHECGVLPDRRPWTAIERIEGTSLSRSFTEGPLAVGELVVLLHDVADLLHHAHGRGIVHRRLSAQAIVRTPQRASSICVRGWGDALTIDASAREPIEPRDDVQALGVLAFRGLTGCWPSPAVQAADWCPHAPLELTALIDSMLAADVAARPSSEEVRERARWLISTVQQLSIDKPRWTPPYGLDPDSLPPAEDHGFAIRITGNRSS